MSELSENEEIGIGRKAKRAYSLDEIALVPSSTAIDPDDVNISMSIGNLTFQLPLLVSAMDATVDTKVAIEVYRLGGLAVLNLEGLLARYTDPASVIDRIISTPKEKVVAFLQEIYREPIKPELIRERVRQVKRAEAKLAVSATPPKAMELLPIALEEGADIAVIQSTVTTVRFFSSNKPQISWNRLREVLQTPLIVGNCVTYEGAKELMEAGADAVLVGVGPGAACTTRQVIGVGVPQATAIADVASAREEFYQKTGKYVTVIADGGMRTGADITKAIACGADGVMLGSPIASATEAPGKGHHWGMATSHHGLPRGTCIFVGQTASLKTILLGPATKDDGTLNLFGALRNGMGICGARNIKEMHHCQIVIAPSINTEGKKLQIEQTFEKSR